MLGNAWGMSSLVCLTLAKGEVPKVEAAGHESHGIRNGDGLDAIRRMMIWGGKPYENIPPRTIKVLRLLLDRYKKNDPDQSIVDLAEIIELEVSVDGGMRSQVFKGHPVKEIVEKVSTGRYRLKNPD